jgi:drug/metabolite transporter (DMT)-like permease
LAAASAPVAAASRRLRADLALLALATMWGATFPTAKYILEHLPPFHYLAIRFALAALVLLPFVGRSLRALPRGALAWGLLAGAALGAGFAFQTAGLRTAGATVAAFLTAVSVPLVPVFGLLLGKRPRPLEWLGVACATGGLAMLTLQGAVRPGMGELLLLGCAVAFAWQILAIDRATTRMPALVLGWFQMVVSCLLCAALAAGEPRPAPAPPEVWWTVAAMGIGASAAAFSVMAWAQRSTDPTHTGLCLAFEPVAAALFSYGWLGERLLARQWLGAVLIVAGIVVAELRPKWRAPESRQRPTAPAGGPPTRPAR